jgi:hypothetical protein
MSGSGFDLAKKFQILSDPDLEPQNYGMHQSQIISENEGNIPYYCQENLLTKTDVFASRTTIFYMGAKFTFRVVSSPLVTCL